MSHLDVNHSLRMLRTSTPVHVRITSTPVHVGGQREGARLQARLGGAAGHHAEWGAGGHPGVGVRAPGVARALGFVIGSRGGYAPNIGVLKIFDSLSEPAIWRSIQAGQETERSTAGPDG